MHFFCLVAKTFYISDFYQVMVKVFQQTVINGRALILILIIAGFPDKLQVALQFWRRGLVQMTFVHQHRLVVDSCEVKS